MSLSLKETANYVNDLAVYYGGVIMPICIVQGNMFGVYLQIIYLGHHGFDLHLIVEFWASALFANQVSIHLWLYQLSPDV